MSACLPLRAYRMLSVLTTTTISLDHLGDKREKATAGLRIRAGMRAITPGGQLVLAKLKIQLNTWATRQKKMRRKCSAAPQCLCPLSLRVSGTSLAGKEIF